MHSSELNGLDMAALCPRLNEGVLMKDMGQVTVIFAKDHPAYLANETCTLILSMLDGTNTVASIVCQIVRTYNVTYEQATRDVEATLIGLAELGVVALVGS